MTLAEFLTQVTTSLTGFVPDLSIYIAGAVVISAVAWAAKRLIKSGR